MFTETIQYLKDQGLTYPQVGLILGSGLGELAEDVENAIRIFLQFAQKLLHYLQQQ